MFAFCKNGEEESLKDKLCVREREWGIKARP